MCVRTVTPSRPDIAEGQAAVVRSPRSAGARRGPVARTPGPRRCRRSRRRTRPRRRSRTGSARGSGPPAARGTPRTSVRSRPIETVWRRIRSSPPILSPGSLRYSGLVAWTTPRQLPPGSEWRMTGRSPAMRRTLHERIRVSPSYRPRPRLSGWMSPKPSDTRNRSRCLRTWAEPRSVALTIGRGRAGKVRAARSDVRLHETCHGSSLGPAALTSVGRPAGRPVSELAVELRDRSQQRRPDVLASGNPGTACGSMAASTSSSPRWIRRPSSAIGADGLRLLGHESAAGMVAVTRARRVPWTSSANRAPVSRPVERVAVVVERDVAALDQVAGEYDLGSGHGDDDVVVGVAAPEEPQVDGRPPTSSRRCLVEDPVRWIDHDIGKVCGEGRARRRDPRPARLARSREERRTARLGPDRRPAGRRGCRTRDRSGRGC